MIVTGGTGALVIAGQQALAPPASVVTDLAPRSTVIFENEQQVRLRPEDNTTDIVETAGTEGIRSNTMLTPNSTELEETVTRVRNRGYLPNALPAVAADLGPRTLAGEQLGNKTFTLRGGATPNVPETYSLIFIDPNDSILSNSGDGKVEIDYEDDTDTNRLEAFQLTIDGLGPHFTAHKVKSINHVVGTLFETSGPALPASTDQLVVSPFVPDTVDGCIGTSGDSNTKPPMTPTTAVT